MPALVGQGIHRQFNGGIRVMGEHYEGNESATLQFEVLATLDSVNEIDTFSSF